MLATGPGMSDFYKVMCGCECCISAKKKHFYLLTRRGYQTKQPKDQTPNAQKIRSGEIASRIFETYNDAMRPHCCNIHNTASDMAMVKMFHFTYEHNALPH